MAFSEVSMATTVRTLKQTKKKERQTGRQSVCVSVRQCKQVLLYLLKRRERAPGWSRDDGLHLASGQPMKRTEDCGSQEEGEHHEKAPIGFVVQFIGTGCKVANEAGGLTGRKGIIGSINAS